MAVTSFIEIVAIGTVAAAGSNARNWRSLWRYNLISGVAAFVAADLATKFNTQVMVPMLLCLNHRLSVSTITCRDMSDATSFPTQFTHAGVGAIAGDSMKLSAAAFVKFNLGIRGRGVKGSKHLYPMSESDSTTGTDDLFNAGALATLATFGTAAILPITDALGNIWAPFSLAKGSQIKTNPTTINGHIWQSFNIAKRIGEMKVRKVGQVY